MFHTKTSPPPGPRVDIAPTGKHRITVEIDPVVHNVSGVWDIYYVNPATGMPQLVTDWNFGSHPNPPKKFQTPLDVYCRTAQFWFFVKR